MMDAADLRIFEAVARLGRMNRAAFELNTVQSNVTARIKLLEEDVKATLFERHSRGVSLTPAGRRLLPYAARVNHLIAEARRAVRDDGTPSGRLIIGSLETTVAVRLSPLLARYVASYPEVDLVLRTGTSAELVEAVLDHQLDGALVCGPVDHPGLVCEPLYQEELALLTAPGMRGLEELKRESDLKIVVLRMGCSYRQRLEEILTRRGIVGYRLLEFGTLEAIFGCVAAGLGISLLPRSLIGPIWPADRVGVHTLPAGEALVDTLFIRRADGFVSSALTAFLRQIRPAPLRADAAE
jgi:LysR family transcriptional regulator, cell division regulator